MTDARLVDQLRAASAVAFPETPSLAIGVTAGITHRIERRRRFVAVAAVAAVVVVVVLAIPGPRAAIARLLGIGGVTLEQVTEYDLPVTASTNEPLGRLVALEEATELVSFTLRIPAVPGLEDPSVYVREDLAGGLVSLVYRNADEGPGLIITQFMAPGEVAIKQIGDGSVFSEVDIAPGLRAFWIDGTHPIVFLGQDGELVEDSARLVADTLLWEEDGITFRIESSLPQSAIVQIARSLR